MNRSFTLHRHLLLFLFILLQTRAVFSQSAEIVRDTYWVPHIIGQTPKDCAYGLAIAMCGDHPQVVVDKVLNIRGQLARFYGSSRLQSDILSRGFRLKQTAASKIDSLPADVRAYIDGFTNGINYFFENFPQNMPAEVPLEKFLPVEAAEVFATYNLLLFNHEYFQFKKDAGELLQQDAYLSSLSYDGMSNQWVVTPPRTADGAAYLLCDPHLPFSGLTASYEAHLLSRDGQLDFEGVFFEGTYFPAMGHNRKIAWSHTSNQPDFADAFCVTLDTSRGDYYIVDGQSKPLNVWQEVFEIAGEQQDTVTIRRSADHGVMINYLEGDQALFAKLQIEGRAPAAEQGYRMITAQSGSEFWQAFSLHQYDKWNTIALDESNRIAYVYNGRVHRRNNPWDARRGPLNGSDPSTLWGELIPYEELPRVDDPGLTFLQNCNDPPWDVCENPGFAPEDVPVELFGGGRMTQRGRRVWELFRQGGDTLHFDYLKKIVLDSKITSRDSIAPVLEKALEEARQDSFEQIDKAEGLARVILDWDGFARQDSAQPSLFYTWRQFTEDSIRFLKPNNIDEVQRRQLLVALIDASNYLKNHFDSLNVPWGRIHRLKRGAKYFPLSGGTQDADEMAASRLGRPYKFESDGSMLVNGGNLMIMLVRIKTNESPRAWTMKPFGQSSDSASSHYDDLTALYSADSLRETWYNETDFRAHAETISFYEYTSLLADHNGTGLPRTLDLKAWPNPFNPSVQIRFSIPDKYSRKVTELAVYNLLGQKVATLVQRRKQAGNYQIGWDAARNFASGMYFIHLSSGGKRLKIKKILLLK